MSCIDSVQGSRFGLSGKGVLIGMIDSGIDYSLDAFLKADGSTRIRYLWDQTNGKEYISEEINQALSAGNLAERYRIVPSVDSSGHGTAVAGIAAEVASESELIVVKRDAKARRIPKDNGTDARCRLCDSEKYRTWHACGSEYQFRQFIRCTQRTVAG